MEDESIETPLESEERDLSHSTSADRIESNVKPEHQEQNGTTGLSTGVSRIPRKDRDRLTQMFKAWDFDKDGNISRADLEWLMDFITDGSILDTEVDELMEAADRNKSGAIELDEFMLWLYNDRRSEYLQEIQPDAHGAGSDAQVLQALQEWFILIDVNGNGTLEFQELAVALMYTRPSITIRELEKHFQQLDPDGSGCVDWNEFLDEHVRLLDAIPRPMEEKLALVQGRITMLEEKATKLKSDQAMGLGGSMTVEELLHRLRARYGSTEAAFKAISTGGVLNIVQFRSLVATLLDDKPNSANVLNCVRELFGAIDLDGGGDIGLEEFQEVEYTTFSKYIPRSQVERRGTALEVMSETITVIASTDRDFNVDVLERRLKKEKDKAEVARLKAKLEAIRVKPLPDCFELDSTGFSFDDPRVVSVEAFEEFLGKRLSKTADFKAHEKQYGHKAAVKLSLFGWSPNELFEALAQGALTMTALTWKDLCRDAPGFSAIGGTTSKLEQYS